MSASILRTDFCIRFALHEFSLLIENTRKRKHSKRGHNRHARELNV
jgi:hypothetical protein